MERPVSSFTFDFTYSLTIADHEICDIECTAHCAVFDYKTWTLDSVTIHGAKLGADHKWVWRRDLPLPADHPFRDAILAKAQEAAPSEIAEGLAQGASIFAGALARANTAHLQAAE